MEKSLCHLLMEVNHALVAVFNVTNMSFNAICENKIVTKISEFTVMYLHLSLLPSSLLVIIVRHKLCICLRNYNRIYSDSANERTKKLDKN